MKSDTIAQEYKGSALWVEIERLAEEIEPQVIAWRRDIHQHPELSNREFRTGKLVAKHLKVLGLEVETEVAHTGVVGILRGGQPGPVVALRADMDALPVTEEVDLPFASKVKAVYKDQEVGVMHACGHDVHTATLMGVAQVLATVREQMPGTVKFIFQPAEEGAPEGEEGGAGLMIRQGALENPRPEAIFGLHIFPEPVGTISYCSGPVMAGANGLYIRVRGRQTHGAAPWGGVDPIVVASQIVLGLQTIVSRQINPTIAPAIVTLGTIHGGARGNIIPDEVVMEGSIRSFDSEMAADIRERVQNTATLIAQSAGATAEVTFSTGLPASYNDPELTARMVSILEKVAGKDKVSLAPPKTGSEDFSFYQQEIPGLFLFVGSAPEDADPNNVPMNHSPHFYVDEKVLRLGLRVLAHMAMAYMEQ